MSDDQTSDQTYRVTASELKSFVERLERLEAEKKDLAEAQKEVLAEAKARGYDTKVIRKVLSLRKREPDDIADELVLTDAAMIADSKRFHNFLTKWKDTDAEIEPFPNDLIVSRGAITDATEWAQELPSVQA